MAKNFLIICVFFFSQQMFAQADFLVGKWKTVAINNGEVYYDSKTDLVTIMSEDLQAIYTGELQVKNLIDFLRKTYTDNHFEFDVEGNARQEVKLFETILEFKYEHDVERKMIIMYDKNSLNETVADEMPYTFIGGQLHVTQALSEEQHVVYTLEKVE